jgi:hypothetical protein
VQFQAVLPTTQMTFSNNLKKVSDRRVQKQHCEFWGSLLRDGMRLQASQLQPFPCLLHFASHELMMQILHQGLLIRQTGATFNRGK